VNAWTGLLFKWFTMIHAQLWTSKARHEGEILHKHTIRG